MNYSNPELLDRLAAEYVLGTLHGLARKRFERIIIDSRVALERIRYWESQLVELQDYVPEIKPRPQLLTSILQRISPSTNVRPALMARLSTWRTVSFAMTVALFALFINVDELVKLQEPQIAQYVTVLASENSQAAWIVRVYTQTGKTTIQSLKTTRPGLQKAFELWMLPNDGSAPLSMGLMPVSGEKELPVNSNFLNILLNTNTLAVSLEPEGGSPTGAPTGPVLYTGTLNTI